MAVIRIMSSIPQVTTTYEGTPATVNTWYFKNIGTSTPSESAADAIGWLKTFYEAIDGLMASSRLGNPQTFKAYSLDDPEPRSPIVEDTHTLTYSGSTSGPSELACCLSYRGTYVSGVNKGRKRGRVYLGPWASAQLDGVTGRPTTTLTSTINTAAGALLTSSQASTDTVWVVYSAVSDTSTNVTGGWVDDNWDIQRRRSMATVTRDQFGQGH